MADTFSSPASSGNKGIFKGAKVNTKPDGRRGTRYLVVHPERCTGCKRCELWCSLVKNGVQNPTRSMIHIVKKNEFNIPITCLQCGLCQSVCPTGAISRDERTGAVIISQEQCVGCEKCVAVCPIGVISFDREAGVAQKCDLCNGDPECVKHCPENALEYCDAVTAAKAKQKAFASILLTQQRPEEG